MSVILIVSIVIRLMALAWSIILFRRIRDWRIAFLTAMIALMAVRQILTLLKTPEPFPVSFVANIEEPHGLMVSILAFLALIFLGRMILEGRKARSQLEERTEKLRRNESALTLAQRIGRMGSWEID